MVKLTSLAVLTGFVALALSSTRAAPQPRHIADSEPALTPLDYNANVKRHTVVYNVPEDIALGVKSADATQTAQRLAQHLIGDNLAQSSMRVRDDSYFDKHHGLWHIYLKQQVNGVDVFNGGLHAVVAESGELQSYSHNLYTGEKPSVLTQALPVTECQAPHHPKRSRISGNRQMVFNADAPKVDLLAPEAALYGFLAAATPDPTMSLAFAQVSQADRSSSYAAPHSNDADFKPKKISNVPTTTGDVDASLVYLITDDCLVLTHRFEVPLEDNEYETYVDASTGKIQAVADWVSGGLARTPSLARPDFSQYKHAAADASQSSYTAAAAAHDEEEETKEPTYRVFQWGENDPTEGKRTSESARHDPEVSPFGWHAHPSSRKPFKDTKDAAFYVDGNLTKYKDLRGNNVFVSWGGITTDDAWDPAMPRPIGKVVNGSRTFDYPYPWRKAEEEHKQLDPKVYAEASQVQLFYTINEYHDLLNHLGFDGAAGNFEEYSEEGKDGDPVVAFAQSANGRNNADFSTPPDGRYGRMRMFKWSGIEGTDEESIENGEIRGDVRDRRHLGVESSDPLISNSAAKTSSFPTSRYESTRKSAVSNSDLSDFASRVSSPASSFQQASPERDGDFEAGIVLHEYSHGLSTRLTGGPSDSSCLGWGESGGFGEGAGDSLATLVRDRNGSTPSFTMGAWAAHSAKGIREWPYSRNISIDPAMYETLNKPGFWAVHAIGTVWATIFLDVVEHAKSEYGHNPQLFPPAKDAPESEQAKFFLTDKELAALPSSRPRASKRRIPRHGNTLMLQLFVDSMKLQPCRPDFLQIRDAIVKADEILTGGANECLLRHAFAKRGLGLDAKVVGSTPWGGGVRTNGFKKPAYCDGTHRKSGSK